MFLSHIKCVIYQNAHVIDPNDLEPLTVCKGDGKQINRKSFCHTPLIGSSRILHKSPTRVLSETLKGIMLLCLYHVCKSVYVLHLHPEDVLKE